MGASGVISSNTTNWAPPEPNPRSRKGQDETPTTKSCTRWRPDPRRVHHLHRQRRQDRLILEFQRHQRPRWPCLHQPLSYCRLIRHFQRHLLVRQNHQLHLLHQLHRRRSNSPCQRNSWRRRFCLCRRMCRQLSTTRHPRLLQIQLLMFHQRRHPRHWVRQHHHCHRRCYGQLQRPEFH